MNKELKIDLSKGFGTFEDYSLTKFPDESIKFKYFGRLSNEIYLVNSLKTNDDLIALGIISNQLKDMGFEKILCRINYMMYQQDDRRFGEDESFGLKIVTGLMNTFPISKWEVFHPHSDKVEFLNNCKIISNDEFIHDTLHQIKNNYINYFINDISFPIYWVIPDSGAFKSQFKQIEKINWKNYIVCSKSRNPETGDLEQLLTIGDLKNSPCVIFDDICLGGRTFTGIYDLLKSKGAGDIYLAISHGIFNYGIDHLIKHGFKTIFTTDSICKLEKSEKLQIYNLQ